ncbi:MAG: 50S ribosomal protein L4 [Patescibacteria group bacterium]
MVKTVKKTTKVIKPKAIKTVAKAAVTSGMTVPVFDATGTSKGTTKLPKELFGAEVNTMLLAQAIRVYQGNQRAGSAFVKTRGQVEGSTRKIYKQKGTGRARHGSIRAHIFVGGGVVFGPTHQNFKGTLTKKMKVVALQSAFSARLKDKAIYVVDGLETIAPKTKHIATLINGLGIEGSILLLQSSEKTNVLRAARNIQDLDVLPMTHVHPYALVSHKNIIIMKSAIKA